MSDLTKFIPPEYLAAVAEYRGMTMEEAIEDDRATLHAWYEWAEKNLPLGPSVPKEIRKRWAVETNPALTDDELEGV